NTIIASMLLFSSFVHGSEHIELSLGPHYANYRLCQNEEEVKNQWNLGGEIGIANFIPNIGLKIRGTQLKYASPLDQFVDTHEYTPLTLCTSFGLLPFLNIDWLKLTLETGLGVYSWKGFDNIGQIVVLPTGEKMEERDIGFVAGFTVQLRPLQFVGLEFASRYHYIASAEIFKYGFDDKDDLIWENGIGVKVIIPLLRR
ncbi:hypothetical protein AMJ52_08730, partial [candidate division TA06 bacterium DG_78]